MTLANRKSLTLDVAMLPGAPGEDYLGHIIRQLKEVANSYGAFKGNNPQGVFKAITEKLKASLTDGSVTNSKGNNKL